MGSFEVFGMVHISVRLLQTFNPDDEEHDQGPEVELPQFEDQLVSCLELLAARPKMEKKAQMMSLVALWEQIAHVLIAGLLLGVV